MHLSSRSRAVVSLFRLFMDSIIIHTRTGLCMSSTRYRRRKDPNNEPSPGVLVVEVYVAIMFETGTDPKEIRRK